MSKVKFWVASAIVVFAALGLAESASAWANASLDTISGRGSVTESSHHTAIRVDGVVATITTTQTFVSKDTKPAGAIYTFQVPRRAVVTSLSVQMTGGTRATAAVVDAHAAVTRAPLTPGAKPDVGLLRLIERDAPQPRGRGDGLATYELRIYPVTKKRAATVRIRWVVPLRYADGRLTLRIPTRGVHGSLARGRVSLTLRPPRGVGRLGAVRGGGRLLSARHGAATRRYEFAAPVHADLSIEATPVFKSSAPVVSFASVSFGSKGGAIAASVLTPLPRRRRSNGYERVLVLVDVSLSMGRAGLGAVANMTDAVLRAVPQGARVDVVLFDRTARRAIGDLIPNLPDARKIIARSIKGSVQRNGSDLGAALDVVRRVLATDTLPRFPPVGITRGNGASTLVAVISDGLAPLSFTGRRAVDRMGLAAIRNSEVLAITLVPDQAPLPTLDEGPLAELAKRSGGRAIAVRFGEIAARGKRLAAELNGPVELENIRLEAPAGTDLAGLSLPRTLPAGAGAIRIGWYRNATPKMLAVRAVRGRKQVRYVARRSRRAWRATLGSLALARSGAAAVLSGSLRATTTQVGTRNTLLRAAARFPAVTTGQSLVAVAPDAFSRQRFALATRWGSHLYRRHATPGERLRGHSFVAYSERVPTMTQTVGGTQTRRRTGSLDRAIVRRLVTTYVVPRARACYELALRGKPRLTGSLTVVMEIARGEVQFAEVRNSTIADAGLLTCLTRAAYGAQVPRVALGAAPDQVSVVRYPIRLRVAGTSAKVERGASLKRAPIKLEGPLGGLPRR